MADEVMCPIDVKIKPSQDKSMYSIILIAKQSLEYPELLNVLYQFVMNELQAEGEKVDNSTYLN